MRLRCLLLRNQVHPVWRQSAQYVDIDVMHLRTRIIRHPVMPGVHIRVEASLSTACLASL